MANVNSPLRRFTALVLAGVVGVSAPAAAAPVPGDDFIGGQEWARGYIDLSTVESDLGEAITDATSTSMPGGAFSRDSGSPRFIFEEGAVYDPAYTYMGLPLTVSTDSGAYGYSVPLAFPEPVYMYGERPNIIHAYNAAEAGERCISAVGGWGHTSGWNLTPIQTAPLDVFDLGTCEPFGISISAKDGEIPINGRYILEYEWTHPDFPGVSYVRDGSIIEVYNGSEPVAITGVDWAEGMIPLTSLAEHMSEGEFIVSVQAEGLGGDLPIAWGDQQFAMLPDARTYHPAYSDPGTGVQFNVYGHLGTIRIVRVVFTSPFEGAYEPVVYVDQGSSASTFVPVWSAGWDASIKGAPAGITATVTDGYNVEVAAAANAPVGAHRLSVEYTHGDEVESHPMTVVVSRVGGWEPEDEVEVEDVKALALSGTVTDSKGKAVRGAEISVEWEHDGTRAGIVQTTSKSGRWSQSVSRRAPTGTKVTVTTRYRTNGVTVKRTQSFTVGKDTAERSVSTKLKTHVKVTVKHSKARAKSKVEFVSRDTGKTLRAKTVRKGTKRTVVKSVPVGKYSVLTKGGAKARKVTVSKARTIKVNVKPVSTRTRLTVTVPKAKKGQVRVYDRNGFLIGKAKVKANRGKAVKVRVTVRGTRKVTVEAVAKGNRAYAKRNIKLKSGKASKVAKRSVILKMSGVSGK